MFPASFVIYFFSERTQNLLQTLRFLERRETGLVPFSELVLVCQDGIDRIGTGFARTTQLNLGMNSYNKPLMNNRGVRLASGRTLILLDSDRILPHGYFTKHVASMADKQVVSCVNMVRLVRDYSDEEIESGSFDSFPDPKNTDNIMHFKNMFSGNTIMRREDYLLLGGMDEGYEGYGYADNDFTRTAVSGGLHSVWDHESLELHLSHGYSTPAYRQQNVMNGVRYCEKWGLSPEGGLKELLGSIPKKVPSNYHNFMKEKLQKIRDLLDEVIASLGDPVAKIQSAPEPVVPEPQPVEPPESKDFGILKELLHSDKWPEAVLEVQIADDNSETDKQERAESIVDLLLPPLKGKKFLDVGCGEGHVAKYVSHEASVSVGYDLRKSPQSCFEWDKKDGSFFLTTNFSVVESEGPYDTILIYDVLDHLESDDMGAFMTKIKSVLKDDGKIYMRCHPWSGRHGGHLYKKVNKAFVHLVFTEQELKLMGLEPEFNRKALLPLATYHEALESAGLAEEAKPEIDTQEVEPFFRDDALVRGRILKLFDVQDWRVEKPEFQMSQCFVDFILRKK